MEEMSKSYFRLEIAENYDPESVSGRAWVIDVLALDGEVILEQAGVAPTLMKAMEEAGKEITYYLASQWLDTALNGEVSA